MLRLAVRLRGRGASVPVHVEHGGAVMRVWVRRDEHGLGLVFDAPEAFSITREDAKVKGRKL